MAEKTAVPDIKNGGLVLYLGAQDNGFGRLRVAHDRDGTEQTILHILESSVCADGRSVADAIEMTLLRCDQAELLSLVFPDD